MSDAPTLEQIESVLKSMTQEDRRATAAKIRALDTGPSFQKRNGAHFLADGEWRRFFSPDYREKCVTFSNKTDTYYRYSPSVLSALGAGLCFLGVVAAMINYLIHAVSSYYSQEPLDVPNVPLGKAKRAVSFVDGIVIAIVFVLTLILYSYLLKRNFQACAIPAFLIWGQLVPVVGFATVYIYMNRS